MVGWLLQSDFKSSTFSIHSSGETYIVSPCASKNSLGACNGFGEFISRLGTNPLSRYAAVTRYSKERHTPSGVHVVKHRYRFGERP